MKMNSGSKIITNPSNVITRIRLLAETKWSPCIC